MTTIKVQTACKPPRRGIKVIARTLVQAAGFAVVLACGPVAADNTMLKPVTLRQPIVPQDDSIASRQVEVFIDFAVILQIPGDVSTVVVGNSAIADASVIAAGTIALTGKSVGTTNIVLLQPDGRILTEVRVQVVADKPGTVTVRRAIMPSIYSCTPAACQRSDGGTDSGASPPPTQ